MVLRSPTVEVALQHLTAVEEGVRSLTGVVSIYIKCTLPQHGEIEVLIIYIDVQTTRPTGEILTDDGTVSTINLTIFIDVHILDVTQLLLTGTLGVVLQVILGVEVAVSHVAIERADGVTFQTPELAVVGVHTFRAAHVGNLVLHVSHVKVDGIAQVLVDALVVEDAQVETGVLHATGILCRSTHTNHTLDGEVQQHVVGLLLIE